MTQLPNTIPSKSKKLLLMVGLMLAGAGYVAVGSVIVPHLDFTFVASNYLALAPIQIGCLVGVLVWSKLKSKR